MNVLTMLLLAFGMGWFTTELARGEDPNTCSGMPSESTCSTTGVGVARVESDEAPRLRWRGFPYKVSNPAFARRIYGGSYIETAFNQQGFEGPVDGHDWDVLWTHRPQDGALIQLPSRPRPPQRLVNHCSYFRAAGDKCNFAKHTNRIMRSVSRLSTGGLRYLRTFELDQDHELIGWRHSVQEKLDKYWLLKPCLGGASKGIQIHRGQDALDAQRKFGPHTVAQEYVDDPYLGFGGRKFHLRLYLLITRWSPAGVYIYDNGLIFRSLHEYQHDNGPEVMRDVFSSISDSVEALPLAKLWSHLDAADVLPAAVMRARIAETLREILGTQQVQESFGKYEILQAQRSFACFDLFGVDIILDRSLQPLVMELNIGPNMWTTDHGEGNRQLLADAKAPLVQQVVHWAALRSSRPPQTVHEAEQIEAESLQNFTRIL